MNDLEQWILLQANMRELQHAEGWDPFVQQMNMKIQETFEAMLEQGPEFHDKNAGFIEGIRWVLGYPQYLVQQVEALRQRR